MRNAGRTWKRRSSGVAVRRGVVGEEVEGALLVLLGHGVLVLQAGFVHAQYAEADVGHGLGLDTKLELLVGLVHLGFDLLAGAADALLADVAEVAPSARSLLGNLDENEATTAAILGILVHDRFCRCGGAGEEVEDEGIIVARNGQDAIEQAHGLGRVEGGGVFEEGFELLLGFVCMADFGVGP